MNRIIRLLPGLAGLACLMSAGRAIGQEEVVAVDDLLSTQGDDGYPGF